MFLLRMEVRIEKFGGNGYHNWSDDIRAVLGVRQVNIVRALRWAERRRDNAIDATAILAEEVKDEGDNEALHAYIWPGAHWRARNMWTFCPYTRRSFESTHVLGSTHGGVRARGRTGEQGEKGRAKTEKKKL